MADKIDTIQKQLDKEIYKTTLGYDNDEIIIGDEASPSTFKNKITFTKWNKENSLSIDFSAVADGDDFVDVDGKTKVKKDNDTKFYYSRHSDNQIKYGLMFKSKPSVNSWTFTLSGQDEFTILKRPPLIRDNGNGTKTFDSSGGTGEHENSNKFYRERIVQALNPYTNELMDVVQSEHFLTILRLKFIDAEGAWVWGDINIDGNKYILTCPQEFLDKAVYPVIANDSVTYQEGTASYTGCVDTFIKTNDGTRYGSTDPGEITYWEENNETNALIKWDLSGLPVGITITGVEISLNFSAADGTDTVTCHRLLRNWVNPEWTFYTADTSGSWSTGGAAYNDLDRAATESASLSLTGTGFKTWGSTAQLITDVTNFYNSTWSNYGWVFWVTGGAGSKYHTWNTSNNGTAANRPKITITYTPSGGGLPLNTAKCYVSMM